MFCVAADLPFLCTEVIAALLQAGLKDFRSGTTQAVAFRREGISGAPVRLLRPCCDLPAVVARLHAGQFESHGVARVALQTHWLPEDQLADNSIRPTRHFRNINTEQAWQDADGTG